jgi:hypothetical protein
MAKTTDVGIKDAPELYEEKYGERNERRKKSHSGYTRTPTNTEPPTRILSATMRKKYGAVEIEFGIEAGFSPDSAPEQERILLGLTEQLNDLHERWAKEQLPYVPFIQRQEAGTVKKYNALLTYTDTDKSGNPRRRIKTAAGTPYHKFGLTIYPELWEKLAKDYGCDVEAQFISFVGVELVVESTNGRGEIIDYKILPSQP